MMRIQKCADRTDYVVTSFLSILIHNDSVGLLTDFLLKMKTFEQRKYVDAIIAYTTKEYFASHLLGRDDGVLPGSKTISGAARLLHGLIKDNAVLKDHVVTLLTRSTIPSLDDSLAARRSVMAALAQDEGNT
jgi:telomere length regulation protein